MVWLHFICHHPQRQLLPKFIIRIIRLQMLLCHRLHTTTTTAKSSLEGSIIILSTTQDITWAFPQTIIISAIKIITDGQLTLLSHPQLRFPMSWLFMSITLIKQLLLLSMGSSSPSVHHSNLLSMQMHVPILSHLHHKRRISHW